MSFSPLKLSISSTSKMKGATSFWGARLWRYGFFKWKTYQQQRKQERYFRERLRQMGFSFPHLCVYRPLNPLMFLFLDNQPEQYEGEKRELVQFLLHKKVDPVWVDSYGENATTVFLRFHQLSHISEKDKAEILTLLLPKATPTTWILEGEHALVSFLASPEVFHVLLPHVSQNSKNLQGNPLLFELISYSFNDVTRGNIEALIETGADVFIQDEFQTTALMLAQDSDPLLLPFLIQQGLNPHEIGLDPWVREHKHLSQDEKEQILRAIWEWDCRTSQTSLQEILPLSQAGLSHANKRL